MPQILQATFATSDAVRGIKIKKDLNGESFPHKVHIHAKDATLSKDEMAAKRATTFAAPTTSSAIPSISSVPCPESSDCTAHAAGYSITPSFASVSLKGEGNKELDDAHPLSCAPVRSRKVAPSPFRSFSPPSKTTNKAFPLALMTLSVPLTSSSCSFYSSRSVSPSRTRARKECRPLLPELEEAAGVCEGDEEQQCSVQRCNTDDTPYSEDEPFLHAVEQESTKRRGKKKEMAVKKQHEDDGKVKEEEEGAHCNRGVALQHVKDMKVEKGKEELSESEKAWLASSPPLSPARIFSGPSLPSLFTPMPLSSCIWNLDGFLREQVSWERRCIELSRRLVYCRHLNLHNSFENAPQEEGISHVQNSCTCLAKNIQVIQQEIERTCAQLRWKIKVAPSLLPMDVQKNVQNRNIMVKRGEGDVLSEGQEINRPHLYHKEDTITTNNNNENKKEETFCCNKREERVSPVLDGAEGCWLLTLMEFHCDQLLLYACGLTNKGKQAVSCEAAVSACPTPASPLLQSDPSISSSTSCVHPNFFHALYACHMTAVGLLQHLHPLLLPCFTSPSLPSTTTSPSSSVTSSLSSTPAEYRLVPSVSAPPLVRVLLLSLRLRAFRHLYLTTPHMLMHARRPLPQRTPPKGLCTAHASITTPACNTTSTTTALSSPASSAPGPVLQNEGVNFPAIKENWSRADEKHPLVHVSSFSSTTLPSPSSGLLNAHEMKKYEHEEYFLSSSKRPRSEEEKASFFQSFFHHQKQGNEVRKGVNGNEKSKSPMLEMGLIQALRSSKEGYQQQHCTHEDNDDGAQGHMEKEDELSNFETRHLIYEMKKGVVDEKGMRENETIKKKREKGKSAIVFMTQTLTLIERRGKRREGEKVNEEEVGATITVAPSSCASSSVPCSTATVTTAGEMMTENSDALPSCVDALALLEEGIYETMVALLHALHLMNWETSGTSRNKNDGAEEHPHHLEHKAEEGQGQGKEDNPRGPGSAEEKTAAAAVLVSPPDGMATQRNRTPQGHNVAPPPPATASSMSSTASSTAGPFPSLPNPSSTSTVPSIFLSKWWNPALYTILLSVSELMQWGTTPLQVPSLLTHAPPPSQEGEAVADEHEEQKKSVSQRREESVLPTSSKGFLPQKVEQNHSLARMEDEAPTILYDTIMNKRGATTQPKLSVPCPRHLPFPYIRTALHLIALCLRQPCCSCCSSSRSGGDNGGDSGPASRAIELPAFTTPSTSLLPTAPCPGGWNNQIIPSSQLFPSSAFSSSSFLIPPVRYFLPRAIQEVFKAIRQKREGKKKENELIKRLTRAMEESCAHMWTGLKRPSQCYPCMCGGMRDENGPCGGISTPWCSTEHSGIAEGMHHTYHFHYPKGVHDEMSRYVSPHPTLGDSAAGTWASGRQPARPPVPLPFSSENAPGFSCTSLSSSFPQRAGQNHIFHLSSETEEKLRKRLVEDFRKTSSFSSHSGLPRDALPQLPHIVSRPGYMFSGIFCDESLDWNFSRGMQIFKCLST